ncbi:MAG: UDP-N-acetylmuramoyl-tripeptide--D-alanyl-D-alanine ligase [Paludibacteraceae bacterium]|nr:UDP-N-acetylmuramoyl-tripeptide--D-alanyl-D-alanine ligase [Paludibacteraceae bacterium]
MDWSFLIQDKASLDVTTDSRKVTKGSIFVALKGEHFDGNDFVEQARKDGAEYVICGEDALAQLQDLARAWRRTLHIPVVGITGTNGKTTTKELCAAVLSTKYRLYYTQGNLNNQIGVPLTVLSITRAHELAIVEMGASHPGDIRELVEIAEPTCGLVTNVGRAHLQGFGSFEGVQATKRELYDWLVAHQGVIFRNADNPFLAKMLEDSKQENPSSIVHRPLSVVNYRTGTMPEGTHLVGGYNAENISAALCVGEYFGVPYEQGLAAVRAYVPSNNRSQLMQTERNTVVVDAYNANPTSMQAAIEAFGGNKTHLTPTLSQGEGVSPLGGDGREVYILGAMRELGEYSRLEHQNIVNMLLERKADKVLLVGGEYKETTAPYPVYDDVDALCEALHREPLQGCRILLKGSRSNRLEKVLPLL